MDLDNLISHINANPSDYEEKYVRWVSIGYDKKALSELLYELKYLRENEEWPERQAFLESILEEHDEEHLINILTSEPQTSRMIAIEKYARQAALEVLIFDRYSIDTLNIITQFPLADYQLIVKRVHEIVALIRDVTTQASALAEGVAGV